MTPSVAQRLRSAFAKDDFEEMMAVLDPDVVWRGIESGAEVPECRNREEVRATFEWHLAQGHHASPRIVEEGEGYLIVEMRPRPPRDWEPFHQVLTVEDDRIVRMQDHPDRASALAQVGSP